jgi:hypothetical protein
MEKPERSLRKRRWLGVILVGASLLALGWFFTSESAIKDTVARTELLVWVPETHPAEECLHRANLLSLGPSAVPKLGQMLGAHEFLWERIWLSLAPLLPRSVVEPIGDKLWSLHPSFVLRKESVNALYALAPEAGAATAKLMEALQDGDQRLMKLALCVFIRRNDQSAEFKEALHVVDRQFSAEVAVARLSLDPGNSVAESHVRRLLQDTSKEAQRITIDSVWLLGETGHRAARLIPDLWNLLTNEIPKLDTIERQTSPTGYAGRPRAVIARALWQIEGSPTAPLLVFDFYRQRTKQGPDSDLWKRRLCLYIGFFGDIPEFADAVTPLLKEWSTLSGETGEMATEALIKIEAIRQAKAEVVKLEAQWKRSE